MTRSRPGTPGLRTIVLVVALTGLAVRVVAGTVVVPRLERGERLGPDADRYAELAASLLDRGTLGFDPPGASPTTVRGPAFSSWLAGGMLAGGRSPGWLAIWAALPGCIAATVVAAVLARSHGAFAGLAGGLIAAAHPLAVFASARLLSDEAYGACLLLALIAWRRAVRAEAPRWGWAALAGGLLAAASLTRPTGLAVAALVIAWTLATAGRAKGLRVAGVIALAIAFPTAGWAIRSSRLAGAPVFIEALPGYNFWLGEADSRFGFASGFGEARARAHTLIAAEAGEPRAAAPGFRYADLAPRDLHAFDEKLTRAAIERVEAAPLAYARRCLSGLFWYWTRGEARARTIEYAIVAFPFVVLAAIGWRRAAGSGAGDGLPVRLAAAVVILHVVAYAAICPMARYSVQLYPVMGYFAGIGCASLARREA